MRRNLHFQSFITIDSVARPTTMSVVCVGTFARRPTSESAEYASQLPSSDSCVSHFGFSLFVRIHDGNTKGHSTGWSAHCPRELINPPSQCTVVASADEDDMHSNSFSCWCVTLTDEFEYSDSVGPLHMLKLAEEMEDG